LREDIHPDEFHRPFVLSLSKDTPRSRFIDTDRKTARSLLALELNERMR